MSGNDEWPFVKWPFVQWPFVRVAFCPVAFCPVAFCPGAVDDSLTSQFFCNKGRISFKKDIVSIGGPNPPARW